MLTERTHEAYVRKVQQLKPKYAKLISQKVYAYCKLFIAGSFNETVV